LEGFCKVHVHIVSQEYDMNRISTMNHSIQGEYLVTNLYDLLHPRYNM